MVERALTDVGPCVTALRAARDTNDPQRWIEAKDRVDQALVTADSAVARARAHEGDADVADKRRLSAAVTALAGAKATIELTHSPLGYQTIAGETELVAVVAGDLGRFEGRLDVLGSGDRLELIRRLRERRPNDPLAAAFVAHLTPEQQRKVQLYLVEASRRAPPTKASPLRTEARAAQSQPTPPQAHPEDYQGSQTGAAYFAWNQTRCFDAIRARLRSLVLPRAHDRLAWVAGPGLAGAIERAFVAAHGTGIDLAARLPELLYPTDPWQVIDLHRDLDSGRPGELVDHQVALGIVNWNPNVGKALALEVEACLRRSLPIMGARYIAQADDYHGDVYAEMLVASCPFDRVVAKLLCDPTVTHFVHARRRQASVPERTAFKNGIRLVTFEWQGDRDPKLWNWVRVIEPTDATAEEVAASMFERGDGVSHTEYAYGLVVAGAYMRVPPRWARQFSAAAAHADRNVTDADDAQMHSALDLADSAAADEVARAQAGTPLAHVDVEASIRTLEQSAALLRLAGDTLGAWKLYHLVGPAVRWATKHVEAMRAAPVETQRMWAAIAAGQASILAEGTGQLLDVADIASRARVTPGSPEAAPFHDVLEAFGIALGESHLARSAAAQLQAAQVLKANLPLVLVDRTLRENHDAAQDLAASDPDERRYDRIDNARAANRTLDAKALDLREQALAGKPIDQAELEALTISAQEESFVARVYALGAKIDALVVGARDALDGVLAKLANVADDDIHALPTELQRIKRDAVGIVDAMHADAMPSSIDPDPARAQVQFAAARKNAVAKAQAAYADLAKREGLHTLFDRSLRIIRDAHLHTLILDIVVLIGVSIASGFASAAIGGVVRGAILAEAAADAAAFARTASAARWAGAAVTVASDAGINAVAQTAVFGGNTKLSFVENVMTNLMTLGALRPIHAAWGSLGELDETAKGLWKVASRGKVALVGTLNLTIDALVGAGASYVAARLLEEGQPSDDVAVSWALQGASIAVGAFIAKRTNALQERLAHLGELGAHLAKRAATQTKLAVAVQHSGSSEQALALIDQHTTLLRDEAALLHDEARLVTAHLDARQLDTLRAGNAAAVADTQSQALDTLKFRFHGLVPRTVDGRVWAGRRVEIEALLAEGGLDAKEVVRENAGPRWSFEFGGRRFTVFEVEHPDVTRLSGGAGPDLHTHMMGVLDVGYFVDKLGGGKAVAAYDAVYTVLAADPEAQATARHAWAVAQRTRAGVDAARGNIKADVVARSALTEMLAAGETTAFDHPYKLRQVIVEKLIDPSGGAYRSYARDTMDAMAAEGIGYAEQSVGLGKLDEKFPVEMMAQLRAELASEGKHVDVRFLAMVSTEVLAGRVTPEKRLAAKAQLERVLQRADVLGIDIAAPERHEFNAAGMASFRELYDLVSTAAKARKRSMVLRPHVGEGYDEGHDDAHVEVARNNLRVLIDTLKDMGYNERKAETDKVIIRFGHAAHATPEMLEDIARLGVIVEANIGSNLITHSVIKLEEHPLLYNLYYGVNTVLGTDGGGVMQTMRTKEYELASDLLGEFTSNRQPLIIRGKKVWFRQLSNAQKRRFTLEALIANEDTYHSAIVGDDLGDAQRSVKR